MITQNTIFKSVLLLMVIGLVGCDSSDGSYKDIYQLVFCLLNHNITYDEFAKFKEFEITSTVLQDELKFKCYIDCLLHVQPVQWLNEQGRMDLQQFNATKEAVEAITECMKDAPSEQCDYSSKLVLCVRSADFPILEYDDYNYDYDESTQTTESF